MAFTPAAFRCPRNFLHRHRLAFQQQGRQFEVFEVEFGTWGTVNW